MEINVKNEYRVEVALTDAELHVLGVSFEDLDYANIETRRALWTVVSELRKRGVEVSLAGKVLIEADKTAEGCRLAITSLPPRGETALSVKQMVKSPKLPALFLSEDPELLQRAAATPGLSADAKRYRLGDRWFLLAAAPCTEEALLQAEEYCRCLRPADAVLVAFLEEHAQRVTA